MFITQPTQTQQSRGHATPRVTTITMLAGDQPSALFMTRPGPKFVEENLKKFRGKKFDILLAPRQLQSELNLKLIFTIYNVTVV